MLAKFGHRINLELPVEVISWLENTAKYRNISLDDLVEETLRYELIDKHKNHIVK